MEEEGNGIALGGAPGPRPGGGGGRPIPPGGGGGGGRDVEGGGGGGGPDIGTRVAGSYASEVQPCSGSGLQTTKNNEQIHKT